MNACFSSWFKFLTALLLLAAPTFADDSWSGGWIGQGTVTEESGEVSPCGGRMQIVINHRKQSNWEGLWVISGLPTCGFPSAFGPSFQLDVQEGNLVHMREIVGEFGDDYLQIIKYSKGFKEYIEISRNPTEDSLTYRKAFTFTTPLENFIIAGTLKKGR